MEKYEYARVTIGSILAVYINIIPDNGDKICVVPAPKRLCPNYVSGHRIVLNRYGDELSTSKHQFGFRKKHSTTMCTMVLKETINYYSTNHSTVFCTMLDASKAFDRIHYCKLFRRLLARKLPAVVLRLLIKLYTCQVIRVV